MRKRAWQPAPARSGQDRNRLTCHGGRWHSAGQSIDAASEHRALAGRLREPDRAWKQGAFAWWNNAGATIITRDYTFAEWPSGQRMLFHLPSDPGQDVNVVNASEHRATFEKLQAALRAGWKAALPSGMNPAR